MLLENSLGSYKFTIQINDVEYPDIICVFDNRSNLLYFGHIDASNNIISFNFNCYNKVLINIKNKDIKDPLYHINEFNILGKNKKYENISVLNQTIVSNPKKFIIFGDSHSYDHNKYIVNYFSYAQYFPYILNDDIFVFNFACSGTNIKHYLNIMANNIPGICFDYSIYNDPNSILFILDGANTVKMLKKYPDFLKDDKTLNDIFIKYNSNINANNKFLVKMYPHPYKDSENGILCRANAIEPYYKSFCEANNIKYLNIDDDVMNHKWLENYKHTNEFTADLLHSRVSSHTNIYGGIFIGNILRDKMKSLGYSYLFNDNDLMDYAVDISEIICKYYN